MEKKERLKLYDAATEKWGSIAQYDQCIEEMAELIVAINKYKRKSLHDDYKENPAIMENLYEEIADVYMHIEQMCYAFGEEKIMEVFQRKLEKFQKLLNTPSVKQSEKN